MKIKVFLSTGHEYRLDFPECKTLSEVRQELNKLHPFITIGKPERVIINVGQIVRVKPLWSQK